MTHNRRILILLGIGSGLIVAAITAFFLLSPRIQKNETADLLAAPIAVNFPAPDLHLTDLQGRPVSFADTRGQVILYNAWATWCLPCREEMPILEAYYQAHRSDGFVVIAVNDGEPATEAAAYAKELSLTFPIWVDLQSQATKAFEIQYLPISYVIDRTGTVRLKWIGAMKPELLEQYVTPLLKEK